MCARRSVARFFLTNGCEAAFVRGLGANENRHTARLTAAEHLVDVVIKIVGRSRATPIIRRNVRATHHAFHESDVAFRSFWRGEFCPRLNNGKRMNKARHTQHPRFAARATNRSHAVRAEELVVPGVDDDEIRRVIQRLSHHTENRIARDGGGAEVDDFDATLRPSVLKHRLQKGSRSEIAWLRKTFHRRFADGEDAEHVRAFGFGELVLVVVTGLVSISEEVGDRAILISDDERTAGHSASLSKN